ncbi:MAG: hypothetical protein ABWY55_03520 [Microbacterium sp.]
MTSGDRGGSRVAHALAATGLAGLLTYVLLAIVSWTVDASEFDDFSVFWSIALILGFGFFLPIEQEAARLGRDARVADQVPRATVRVAVETTIAVTLLVCLSIPLLTGALHLSPGLVACCVGVVLASAVQFSARGAMLASSRSTAFSNTLILDTVLRVALLGVVAVGVVVAGLAPAAVWYAVALIVAIIASHAWALVTTTWGPKPSPAVVTAFRRAALVLIGMSLCAQIMINVGPLVIQALEPDSGLAGAFQASSTLARIPLALITPVQAMLVVPLAALALGGDIRGLQRTMRRVSLAAVALAVLGGVVGFFLGPWIVELVFGPGRALDHIDLALLVSGVILNVALIIFTQALIAMGRHRSTLVAWALALAVMAVCFFLVLPGLGVVLAVELGFGIGSLAGAAIAFGFLDRAAHTSGSADDGAQDHSGAR